jgi:ceramide glucosyltransferase
LPIIAVGIVASALNTPVAPSVGVFGAIWYGGEMVLAAAAGWRVSARSPLCALVRDLLLPVLFVSALRGNGFVWRGNEMQVERMQPERMMALVRPRVHDIAQGSRRRLRALRARSS